MARKSTSKPIAEKTLDEVFPEETKPIAEKPTKGKSYVAAISFRDKYNFSKKYAVGESVNHFDKQRLEDLLNLGYVKEA